MGSRWEEVWDPSLSGSKVRGRGFNRGATKRLRTLKQREAEDRTEVTPWERTAAYRRSQEGVRRISDDTYSEAAATDLQRMIDADNRKDNAAYRRELEVRNLAIYGDGKDAASDFQRWADSIFGPGDAA